jgi:hypothetical protein
LIRNVLVATHRETIRTGGETPPLRITGSLLIILTLAGCKSPEYGRPRGGGHGGDAGNYVPGHIHVPSKIDGTKTWPYPFATTVPSRKT